MCARAVCVIVFATCVLWCGCDDCDEYATRCAGNKIEACVDGRWSELVDCDELLDGWTCCDADAGQECGVCDG